MGWFEVDKGGLRQLLEGKDKSFILRELIQNSWDEPDVTQCKVTLFKIRGKRIARLRVEDDAPEGFYDLTHAFTLFANTRKRKDVKKRGRFNLGEKQVLAMCREAKITTTTGGVEFLENGKKKMLRKRRESGSVFEAKIPMTDAEYRNCCHAVKTFIPPIGMETIFNEEEIEVRTVKAVVEATLQTEFENEKGEYRTTRRKTLIEIYEPREDEKAMIYEMGLPIIETGDKWHYNILQRVPMTADRDNVKPAFLQDVRAEVANAMRDEIEEDDAGSPWVRDAASDDRIKPETVNRIADKRWGEKRVVCAPGDSHGREQALARGYHIVAPGEMSAEEWEHMREADAVPAASKLFPQEFVNGKEIPESKWTEGQHTIANLARFISKQALGFEVTVRIVESPKATVAAQYGNKCLTFNLSKLGKRWFVYKDGSNWERVIELIIHELGHQYGSHLTQQYYDGLCKIGTKLALIKSEYFLPKNLKPIR